MPVEDGQRCSPESIMASWEHVWDAQWFAMDGAMRTQFLSSELSIVIVYATISLPESSK